MSLINTLAPVILAVIFGLVVIVVLGAWATRFVSEARANEIAQKRDLRLERQAYQFVETLFIESNSISSDVTLTPELSDELWKLHNQIDQRKELTR
jgi:hypothetical protein